MKKILIICLSALLLAACNKEEKLAYQFAGTWDIEKVETKYYSGKGNTTDSTRVLDKPGTMVLINTTDNDYAIEEQFCRMTFAGDAPQSFVALCNRAQVDYHKIDCHYSAGPHSSDRLTIWIPVSILHEFETYTVLDISRNAMTLSFTKADAEGYLQYEETWELKARR